MFLYLLGNEEVFGDMGFFGQRISREINEFHTIAQRTGNGFRPVGGGNEHDVAQVEGGFQVMVRETVVLLGVQDLQQCARGIAFVVGAQFVDLIQIEDGIVGTGFFDALNDPAGHGADVGPAMTADLGFVANAAEGHAMDFPAHGAGNGFGHGGLAGSGRAYKT